MKYLNDGNSYVTFIGLKTIFFEEDANMSFSKSTGSNRLIDQRIERADAHEVSTFCFSIFQFEAVSLLNCELRAGRIGNSPNQWYFRFIN